MKFHLKIHVTVDSRKETIEKVSIDKYHICVKEPAEANRANKRILEIVKSLYPDSIVRMVSGHHSPRKLISVETSLS